MKNNILIISIILHSNMAVAEIKKILPVHAHTQYVSVENINVNSKEIAQSKNIAAVVYKIVQNDLLSNQDVSFIKKIDHSPLISYQDNLVGIIENKKEDLGGKQSPFCTGMSQLNTKQAMNEYIKFHYCLNQIINSHTKKIIANGNENFPAEVSSSINDQLDLFLKGGQFHNIVNLYKINNKLDYLIHNMDEYIDKNKKNSANSQKVQFLKEQKKFIYFAKEIQVNHTELKNTIRSIFIEFKKNDPDNIKIVKMTLDLINFYETNKEKMDQKNTIKELNILGRILISNHFDNLSRKVYQLTLPLVDESNEIYFEVIFNYLWTYFKTHDYQGAYAEIKKMGMIEKFDSFPSNIQFWVVHSIEKTVKNKFPLQLYKKIIEIHPLSLYSVLSLKKISEKGGPDQKSQELIQQGLDKEKHNLKNNRSANTLGIFVSKNVENQLKKILIWYTLNNKKYGDIETRDFLSKNFQDEIHFKFDGQTIINSALKAEVINTITLAKFLQQHNQFIKSFTLLQDLVEKEKSFISSHVLSLLFPINKILNKQAKANTLLLDSAILHSLMRQESGFNPLAHSSAGAMGLMQLMPGSARIIKKNIKGKELFNPDTNIFVGQRFLKRLINKYKGNLIYSFAAYNAGEGNLERWRRKSLISDGFIHTLESIPFSETRLYVKLLLRNLYFYKFLYEKKPDSNELDKFFDVAIITQSHGPIPTDVKVVNTLPKSKGNNDLTIIR